MVKYLTLDSSVFVTALRKDEEYHKQKTVFVTLDTEMAKVAKDTVKIKGIKELTGQQM